MEKVKHKVGPLRTFVGNYNNQHTHRDFRCLWERQGLNSLLSTYKLKDLVRSKIFYTGSKLKSLMLT